MSRGWPITYQSRLIRLTKRVQLASYELEDHEFVSRVHPRVAGEVAGILQRHVDRLTQAIAHLRLQAMKEIK